MTIMNCDDPQSQTFADRIRKITNEARNKKQPSIAKKPSFNDIVDVFFYEEINKSLIEKIVQRSKKGFNSVKILEYMNDEYMIIKDNKVIRLPYKTSEFQYRIDNIVNNPYFQTILAQSVNSLGDIKIVQWEPEYNKINIELFWSFTHFHTFPIMKYY